MWNGEGLQEKARINKRWCCTVAKTTEFSTLLVMHTCYRAQTLLNCLAVEFKSFQSQTDSLSVTRQFNVELAVNWHSTS
jgi:hypothetical protein